MVFYWSPLVSMTILNRVIEYHVKMVEFFLVPVSKIFSNKINTNNNSLGHVPCLPLSTALQSTYE